MYRVWYSTESFADYVIDHTKLSKLPNIIKNKMYESDANNPTRFHTMPDHIRKILYLDAPDLIVEKDNEPVFSIEVTTEAGTGHNAFQRFARIAASVENSVPAFYIYPEGAIITRKGANPIWDRINPLIFHALESVMSIYEIPALLYYFPSDIESHLNTPHLSPNLAQKGLQYDPDIVNYPGCPKATSPSMVKMFEAIDEILTIAVYEKNGLDLIIKIRQTIGVQAPQVEKNEDFLELYVVDGVEYYIFSNSETLNAAWSIGEFECIITGKITLEEMKKMIDSIR